MVSVDSFLLLLEEDSNQTQWSVGRPDTQRILQERVIARTQSQLSLSLFLQCAYEKWEGWNLQTSKASSASFHPSRKSERERERQRRTRQAYRSISLSLSLCVCRHLRGWVDCLLWCFRERKSGWRQRLCWTAEITLIHSIPWKGRIGRHIWLLVSVRRDQREPLSLIIPEKLELLHGMCGSNFSLFSKEIHARTNKFIDHIASPSTVVEWVVTNLVLLLFHAIIIPFWRQTALFILYF